MIINLLPASANWSVYRPFPFPVLYRLFIIDFHRIYVLIIIIGLFFLIPARFAFFLIFDVLSSRKGQTSQKNESVCYRKKIPRGIVWHDCGLVAQTYKNKMFRNLGSLKALLYIRQINKYK